MCKQSVTLPRRSPGSPRSALTTTSPCAWYFSLSASPTPRGREQAQQRSPRSSPELLSPTGLPFARQPARPALWQRRWTARLFALSSGGLLLGVRAVLAQAQTDVTSVADLILQYALYKGTGARNVLKSYCPV